MIIKTIPPIRVDTLPIHLFIVLPKYSPKYVKIDADMENMVEQIQGFLYITFNPKPTEKLSKLTAKPKINNSLSFIKEMFFSILNDSMIISIPIKTSTIKTIVLVETGNIFKI